MFRIKQALQSRVGQAGFTLTEMMVVVAITGVVSTALYQMLIAGQQSYEVQKSQMDMQQNARVGLQSMADDLRQVSYGKDATQPSIYYAGPDSVSFVADLLHDHPGAEVVSFFLESGGDASTPNPNDTMLMRVVSDTTGAVLVSAPQTYGVSNEGLNFRWFNGSGVELENPVDRPELIGEIFMELTTTSSEAVDGEYPVLSLSTTIYPRNLPLSPARSRPSTPGCTTPTYPNCESSSITWTTPTTNTDGTDLPLEDISHFNFYFGTDPDELSLYTRLARTINTWAVDELETDVTYYLAISCVSRSGVESYNCTREAFIYSASTPKVPQNLIASLGAGVTLTWDPVSEFDTDDPITTPVSYNIYRGTTAGFTPDETTYLASVSYLETYDDTGGGTCSTYYYVVAAEACGNESPASNEVDGSLPAVPACATSIAANSSGADEILVSWSPPTLRADGTPLDLAEIEKFIVYVDSVSGSTANAWEITAPASSATIDGLLGCTTYYVNVTAVDDCGHEGDFCLANETTVFTASPCDVDPPADPGSLVIVTTDETITLEWPINTTDCDHYGYRIYYGDSPSSFNGTDADEGASPIEVAADLVTVGDVCRYTLSGLGTCETYYVGVTSIDQCSPANESGWSPFADGTTECAPCTIEDGCPLWAVDGAYDNQLHLELFTDSAGSEYINSVTANHGTSALLKQIWFGRPIAKIWDHDGSAGDDGYVSPLGSGGIADIDDVSVEPWTWAGDGLPFMLVFDGDVRGTTVDVQLGSSLGSCTVVGAGTDAALVDDFDDGSLGTAWSPQSGNWTISGGELYQNFTGSNYIVLTSASGVSATTIDAKVYASGGSFHSVYLVFRYQNSSNYYLYGIRTDSNRVRSARISGGTFIQTAQYTTTLADNTWYHLRAVVEGTRLRGYFNCELVIDVDDGAMWSSGTVGLTTRNAAGRFDDVKIFNGAVLPS